MINKQDITQKIKSEIREFRLTNAQGNYIELLNYGATIKSIVVPDRNGTKENIVLGYSTLDGYLTDGNYIGVTVGPFANRIANASFYIDNIQYRLDSNDGLNNNHSGDTGFHNKIFSAEATEKSVFFKLLKSNGDGGFPGELNVSVTYQWTDDNELIILYKAETDKSTPVNLTNHSYFNLSACKETIHQHNLKIFSDSILETREDFVPTGKVIPVGKLKLDGEILEKVMNGKGFNNYYIFNGNSKCVLTHKASGRFMEVYTDYPGVQLYTGDYIVGSYTSYHNKLYNAFDGLCLECQYYPDSPNHSNFPNTILNPGETYLQKIVYKFGVQL